jgi:hypothetical protein
MDWLGMLVHERDSNGLWLGFAGEFSYYTAWKLDKKYERFGTLTQIVRMRGQVAGKDGAVIRQWDFNYTEAWRVLPNFNRTYVYGLDISVVRLSDPDPWGILDLDFGSFRADDLFHLEEQGRCTKGWALIKGSSAFYEGVAIPDDWSTTDVPEAGGRPAKAGPHNLASTPTEGPDTKGILVSWDCIAGDCETKVIKIQ